MYKFQFFFQSLLYNTYGHFLSVFSAITCFRIMKFCVHLQVGKVYCVNDNKDAYPHFAFFISIFQFLYPPQTLFVVGILFSRCPCVRVCVRPCMRVSLRNVLDFHQTLQTCSYMQDK